MQALKKFHSTQITCFSFPILPGTFVRFGIAVELYVFPAFMSLVKCIAAVQCDIESVESQHRIIMVLLPKPPTPKEPSTDTTRNVFFENDTMDHLAKHFVGNNFR